MYRCKKSQLFLITVLIITTIFMITGCAQSSTQVSTVTVTTTAPAKTITTTQAATQTTPIVIKAQHMDTTGGAVDVVLKKYAAMVEGLTNGGLKINWLAGGSVVPVADTLDAVGKGVIDMSQTQGSFNSAKVPLGDFLTGFPGYLSSPADAIRFQKHGFLDLVSQAYAPFGAHTISLVIDGDVTMMCTKKVTSLADVKGLKVVAGGSRGKILAMAGASPVTMAGSEMYTALSTKVVDAVIYDGWMMAGSIGLIEISQYAISGFYGAKFGGEFIVNQKLWDSLPATYKDALTMVYTQYGNSILMDNESVYAASYTKFVNQYKGSVAKFSEADQLTMRGYSQTLMQELATKDPKYCGAALDILKEMWASNPIY